MKWTDQLALVAITLWVGALWAIGYIAAPTLFYHLPDRQLAGNLAGQIFWAAFFMLLLAIAGHFGIAPVIAQLKEQALPSDVMHSVFADRFETWHGVASIAYALESLLGLVLVFRAVR